MGHLRGADGTIPYDLRDSAGDEAAYDRAVRSLSREVQDQAVRVLDEGLQAMRTWLLRTERETLRSAPERALELLMLGVLWDSYGHRSMRFGGRRAQALVRLTRLQRRTGRWKRRLDGPMGVLKGLLLRPVDAWTPPPPLNDTGSVQALADWLEAAGEFPQEVHRIRIWQELLTSLPAEKAREILRASCDLSEAFARRSQEQLGPFTRGVEGFLRERTWRERWREDSTLRGRRRTEYHLGMVGTEILNRAYRKRFLATRRKLVLLPPCMTAHPESCRAEPTPLGARCTGCTPECGVREVTELGDRHGFGVLILPDDLGSLARAEAGSVERSSESGEEPLGVVGVSCALTNMPGGWETHGLGVPAQGLLLSFTGCPWHWHPTGILTRIDRQRLLRVVGA